MKIRNVALNGSRVKAGPADGLAEGQFTAYASVFGNRDSYGDVVMPGAFAKTLSDWNESGNVIPLLWGHDFGLHGDIGHVVEAVEDEHGLLVKGQFDLDDPGGMKAYRRAKGRRVNQMSFAYDVIEGGYEKADGEEFYALREVKLHEVSLVMIGANEQTEILAVKAATDAMEAASAFRKAGRTLSAKNELAIREAVASLSSVLSSLEDSDGKAAPAATEVQSEASGTPEANSDASDEEREAKSSVSVEEPKVSPSVRLAAKTNNYAALFRSAEEGA